MHPLYMSFDTPQEYMKALSNRVSFSYRVKYPRIHPAYLSGPRTLKGLGPDYGLWVMKRLHTGRKV